MKKAKKIFIAALSFLLIFLCASALYINNLLNSVNRTILVNDEGKPVTRKDLNISTDAPKEEDTGIKNILLIGIDQRRNEKSHSDTMLIASIDSNNEVVKLTSLMRDLWVPIPGRYDDRINTAYFRGGPLLTIKTVNFNFKMDIEDYIAVDFESFKDIIEAVGGVEVDVKNTELRSVNEEIQWHNSLSKRKPSPPLKQAGLQTLDGCQALSYARIRNVGNSDWDRTRRQRYVMSQIFKKCKQMPVTKIPGIVRKILPNIETSLTNSEIIELGNAILKYRNNEIVEYRVPASRTYSDEYRGKALVIIPDIEENTKLLHEFIYGKAQS